MLFERFVFVLYILFSYSWFLLGTLYNTPVRYVPIIALFLSLCSIVIVTLFQLQRLARRQSMSNSDRWATIVWSLVHLMLSLCLFADALELTNILVIFCIIAIIITVVIATVATCACYVIILDSDDWRPHVHLACICFWMLIQFMTLRLPIDEFQYVTVIPVVLMWVLRMCEHFETTITRNAVLECSLFVVVILLHVLLNTGLLSAPVFYWGVVSTVCALILTGRHLQELLTVIVLPFFVLVLGLYLGFYRMRGIPTRNNLREILRMYDEMTSHELVLTLDGSDDEDNWDERL